MLIVINGKYQGLNIMYYNYQELILDQLSIMDAAQLKELLFDMDDIRQVKFIYKVLGEYIESIEGNQIDEESTVKSDEDDWKELDDAQRLRDLT